MPQERLQKIIASAGIASRRKAEELILAGSVTINGKVVTELGTRADPEVDHVKVAGKLITRPEEKRYILVYKPRNVMTTVSDPEGRPTVLDLVKGVRERIYPVGRLDFQSEGLILLTNDGELAHQVSHPTNGSVKTYHVKVRGVPAERIIDKLQRGITIEGKRTLPCQITALRKTSKRDDEGNSWWEVRLREGRTQQIRRMFQAVGHPVSKLRRVAIGAMSDAKLGPGDWRELSDREIRLLTQPPEEKKRPTPRTKAITKAKVVPGERGARGPVERGPRKKATRQQKAPAAKSKKTTKSAVSSRRKR